MGSRPSSTTTMYFKVSRTVFVMSWLLAESCICYDDNIELESYKITRPLPSAFYSISGPFQLHFFTVGPLLFAPAADNVSVVGEIGFHMHEIGPL